MPQELIFCYASKKHSSLYFYEVGYFLKKMNLIKDHANVCEIIDIHKNKIKKDKFESFLYLKSNKSKPFVFISCLN